MGGEQSGGLGDFGAMLRSASGNPNAGGDLLVVVAHPDDETIGLGGHFDRLPRATIVHVTDGAPRNMADAHAHGFAAWEDYAAARRRELLTALGMAGLGADALIPLGVPDQETPRRMGRLALQLAELFAARGARFVCTHPFEGGHPDHDATAFAVHTACAALRRRGLTPPLIIETASYHLGRSGPVFQRLAEGGGPELWIELDDEAAARKQRMLAVFVTQQQTLAQFHDRVERFRLAPAYDFTALPNDGRLYYERLGFGFSGRDWLNWIARAEADTGREAA